MPVPTPASTAEPRPRRGGGFSQAAGDHVRATQAALIDLLAAVGLGGARPTDVARTLGLDKTLAWKISRFIEKPDPVQAARHMPGSGGVMLVLKAAERQGVDAARVDAVREADALLREFVRKHAGDRRSFEAMLASGERDERLEHEERREYYRSGSAIWGVRARVHALALMLRASPDQPGRVDLLQVGGLIDLERLRPDLPWIVRRVRAFSDSASENYTFRREPLDPTTATPAGMPLLPRFCSDPLPELRRFTDAAGWVCDEVLPGPIGRSGTVTCISGERYFGPVSHVRAPDNTQGKYILAIRTPVEHALFDVYLHSSLAHFGPMSASVYGLLENRMHAGAEQHPMYEPEPAPSLGSPPRVQSHLYADHGELIRWAIEQAGWPGLEEFRGYRAELAYPPAPCEVALTCDIHDA